MKVNTAKRNEGRYPTFAEFADFVLEQADCDMSPIMRTADGEQSLEQKSKAKTSRPDQSSHKSH